MGFGGFSSSERLAYKNKGGILEGQLLASAVISKRHRGISATTRMASTHSNKRGLLHGQAKDCRAPRHGAFGRLGIEQSHAAFAMGAVRGILSSLTAAGGLVGKNVSRIGSVQVAARRAISRSARGGMDSAAQDGWKLS